MAKDIMAEIMAAIGEDPNNAAMLEKAKADAQKKVSVGQVFSMDSMGTGMSHGMQTVPHSIPPHIREFLGPPATIIDSGCDEPIAWGFPVVGRMGEELWAEAQKHGKMLYDHGAWYLVTKFLTREEAMAKYGPITNEEIGPRGGWRNTTFGQTLFKSKLLAPKKEG